MTSHSCVVESIGGACLGECLLVGYQIAEFSYGHTAEVALHTLQDDVINILTAVLEKLSQLMRSNNTEDNEEVS